MHIATETISASGYAHQTASSPPVFANTYASGNSARSWRANDSSILGRPLPSAWNTEPDTAQKPANIKQMLIFLKAGTPISSIVSEALNIDSKRPGKIWNSAKPMIIMTVA